MKTTITHEEHKRLQELWKIYDENTLAAVRAIGKDEQAHQRHDRLAGQAIVEIKRIQGM